MNEEALMIGEDMQRMRRNRLTLSKGRTVERVNFSGGNDAHDDEVEDKTSPSPAPVKM